jgi:hypothetical protein
MSWPLNNPLDEALVGVDDVVDVDEGDVSDAEDDKDIEEDVDGRYRSGGRCGWGKG